jgi:hypothetical protein
VLLVLAELIAIRNQITKATIEVSSTAVARLSPLL